MNSLFIVKTIETIVNVTNPSYDVLELENKFLFFIIESVYSYLTVPNTACVILLY